MTQNRYRLLEKWQQWGQTFGKRYPRLKFLYRLSLLLIGSVIILAGIAMLVLPGPGWLTIFLGLALIGSEYAWARRLLAWLRTQVANGFYRGRNLLATWRARKQSTAQATAQIQSALPDAHQNDTPPREQCE